MPNARKHFFDEMMDTTAAAAHCDVPVRRLQKMRVVGLGPAFFVNGGRVLYRRDDLERWLASTRTSPQINSKGVRNDEAA